MDRPSIASIFYGVLRGRSAGKQLLYLLLLIFFCTSFFYTVGLLLLNFFSELDLLDNPDALTDLEAHPSRIMLYRWMLLFQHLGMFILPSFLFPYLLGERWSTFLRFIEPKAGILGASVLLMLFFLPLSNYIAELNAGLGLPESLDWLEERFQDWEENARAASEALLRVDSIPGLLGMLLLAGVMPAVGEEAIFRGSVLPLLRKAFGNIHLAIWISALLFSAMHLQFYGFLPRLALGVLFGYLFVWTGTLWVPILMHFFNNAFVVFLSFWMHRSGRDLEELEEAGAHEGQGYLLLISVLVVAYMLYWFWQKREELT